MKQFYVTLPIVVIMHIGIDMALGDLAEYFDAYKLVVANIEYLLDGKITTTFVVIQPQISCCLLTLGWTALLLIDSIITIVLLSIKKVIIERKK